MTTTPLPIGEAAEADSATRLDTLSRRCADWLAARAFRRAWTELDRLDDRILQDIGVNREELRRVCSEEGRR